MKSKMENTLGVTFGGLVFLGVLACGSSHDAAAPVPPAFGVPVPSAAPAPAPPIPAAAPAVDWFTCVNPTRGTCEQLSRPFIDAMGHRATPEGIGGLCLRVGGMWSPGTSCPSAPRFATCTKAGGGAVSYATSAAGVERVTRECSTGTLTTP